MSFRTPEKKIKVQILITYLPLNNCIYSVIELKKQVIFQYYDGIVY